MQLRRTFVFFRFLSASIFPWTAVILAVFFVAALAFIVPRYLNALTTLNIAVAAGGDDAQLVKALARALANSSTGVRLRPVEVADSRAAAGMMEQKQADLAVVRGDGALPADGATVLVFHRDAVLIVLSPGRKIRIPGELARKRIGVWPQSRENTALLETLLADFSLRPADIEPVLLAGADIASAIQGKRLDALAIVAPISGAATDAAIAAMKASGKGAISILDIPGAEGIAARHGRFKKIDIPEGFFGAAPLLPAKDIGVLGFDYLLLARGSLDETIVSNLTKSLFALRREVLANTPLAARMEKPDDEKTSIRALHPGAAAYYGDTEKTFLDRYGDWFYIGAMLLGGLGSALAGLLSIGQARGRRAAMGLIDSLIAVKIEAHRTLDFARLAELDGDIERLSTSGLQFARDSDFDEAGLAALQLAIDEARKSVGDQRNELMSAASANVTPLRPADTRAV